MRHGCSMRRWRATRCTTSKVFIWPSTGLPICSALAVRRASRAEMSLLELGLENDEGPAAAATGPLFLPRRKPTQRAPEPSRCQSLIPANGRFDRYGGSDPQET